MACVDVIQSHNNNTKNLYEGCGARATDRTYSVSPQNTMPKWIKALTPHMASSKTHATTVKSHKMGHPSIHKAINDVRVAQPAFQIDSSKLQSEKTLSPFDLATAQKPKEGGIETQSVRTFDSSLQDAPKGDIYSRIFKVLRDIKNQTGEDLSKLCSEMELRTRTIEQILQLNGELIKSKGAVDFSKNEELKKLIDTLRATGLVDLPVGKYSWTEEEKEDLKRQLDNAKQRCERLSQEIQFKLQKGTTEDSTVWETMSMIFKRMSQAMETIVSNIK